MTGPVLSTTYIASAFRSSDCCGKPMWRTCWKAASGKPDEYVCASCGLPCTPVEDPRP